MRRRAATRTGLTCVVALSLVLATGCGAPQDVDPTQASGGLTRAQAAQSEGESGAGADSAAAGESASAGAGGSLDRALAGSGAAGSGANAQGRAGAVGSGKNDVGVSDSTILLGNVTSLSGPLPGQFDGMPNATKAFIADYNAKGGFRGRKLKLVIRDDGLDPNKHLSVVKQLVEEDKVFALINDGTVVHGTSAEYLKSKNVPVISGSAFDDTYCTTSNFFSLNTYCPHEAGQGGWVKWGAEHGVKKAALLYINLGITQELHRAMVQAFKDWHIDLVYDREVQLVEADYTPYVLAARSAGADTVFTLIDNASIINMLKAMKRQNWSPGLYPTAGQDSKFLEQVREAGLSVDGMVTQGGPLEGEPTEADYNRVYKQYFPDQSINAFSRLGWEGMLWFVDIGLGRLGPDITRDAVMKNLLGSSGYTFRGMSPPLEMGPTRHVQSCGMLVTAKGGKPARLHDGWYCAPLTKF
jgi:ABC-type branched-subunit amino acid transport system substrate-binding protein